MGEIYSSSEKLAFIEKAFGTADAYSQGNVQVKCPKCLESHQKMGLPLRKRKLAINILKGDVFHCWVCSYKGHLSMALRKYCSSSHLEEYMQRFADKSTLSAQAKKPKEKECKKEISLPPDFRLLALNLKSKDYKIKKAISYIKERGMTERDLWYFKIGISDEWPWTDRILFPSFDSNGDFNYMVGRSWKKDTKYPYWDTPVDATSIVFNEINIDWKQEVTLVEGVIDLAKANDNAVPLLGSDIRNYSKLFKMIVTHKTPVLLAMDKDMYYKKMPKIISLILRAGITLRVLDLEGYGDVGEMTKEEFEKRRQSAPIWDSISLLTHKINSIQSRAVI